MTSQDISIPAVITSSVAQSIPVIPESAEQWIHLHHEHLKKLASAYGAIVSRLGLDGIVIHSGLSLKRYSGDDQYWPATMTPHFQHWLPYKETPALLVLELGKKPKLVVEEHQSFWEGPAPGVVGWGKDFFDWQNVASLDAEKGLSRFAFIGDDLRLATALQIAPENRNRVDLVQCLDQLRTLKSNYEIAAMRKATIVALRGHEALKDAFLGGASVQELALHQLYLAETMQTDFDVPYGNIVALGGNCGILHHVHYDRTFKTGDLSLLVDAGATERGYASDITRTWVRGKSSGAVVFKSLCDGVDALQRRLVAEFKVGVEYEELHNRSHELIGELIAEVGLVRLSAQDLVSTGVTRLFFPHGLGHSLGLQVHDVGMKLRQPSSHNPYLRNTTKIQAGQVCTIEPGLYFIPTLMDKLLNGPTNSAVDQKMLNELLPYGGIRIEDNILASNAGPLNLTRWDG
jgi:Xaa-Pro dipeptidase